MAITIVSNTSPISNLATVGWLTLLQQLFGTILIPVAVYEELLDERAGETVITAVQPATWIGIQPVQNQELVMELRNRVNVGEAEAIALHTQPGYYALPLSMGNFLCNHAHYH